MFAAIGLLSAEARLTMVRIKLGDAQKCQKDRGPTALGIDGSVCTGTAIVNSCLEMPMKG